MTELRISADLSLPLDFVTKTCGILAQRRKGKTYTASVLAEELVAAKVPWVALDPTGAWWGLRASADAKSAGLPVIILGGQHADVPLERTGGKVVADLVVESPGFYVIDLSLFESKEAERQFATDFAERLSRLKKQPGKDFAMHLFVDEADMFIPQQSPSGDKRMLGAFEALVRRGGLSGLGTTLISQRAAVVNKNALEQLDMLIVLRNVGPNDRKAIDGYIVAKGTETERREMMDSLASLKLGEAWVWEPGAEPPLFDRVMIRERHTFNSSATPKAGERRVEPRQLAEVDLRALTERMAATIEKAKAEDPRELRRQIAALKKELAGQVSTKYQEPPTLTVEVPVEVPILTEDDRLLLKELAAASDRLAEQLATTREGSLSESLFLLRRRIDELVGTTAKTGARPVPVSRPQVREQKRNRQPDLSTQRHASESVSEITKPQQRILDALAWWNAVGFDPVSKLQVGYLAGYRVSKRIGGHYGNLLGSLRTAELIAYPSDGMVTLTEAGRAAADPPDIEATTDGLQEAIFARLSQPERRILAELVIAYPEQMTKQELGERSGYTVGDRVGGHFGNLLGQLRTLGLIDYPQPGYVVALPVLFLEDA